MMWKRKMPRVVEGRTYHSPTPLNSKMMYPIYMCAPDIWFAASGAVLVP